MSESAIRAQIKTILEGVSGIGAVHAYERYPRSLADYFSLMTAAGVVNGWTIHREATSSSHVTMGVRGWIERAHTYRLSGIYNLDDDAATEVTLQALVEAVWTAFKDKEDLNGSCFRTDLLSVDSVQMTDLGELGADLYHVVQMTLVAYERIQRTT